MRSKAPLAMMEEMVMILVFALAAALCLQAFVKSDQMSKASEARDHAAVLCQSVAEAVRASGGDLYSAMELAGLPASGPLIEAGPRLVEYDAQWNIVDPGSSEDGYTLVVSHIPSGVPGLGKASVYVVSTADDTTIFELEVSWQEVSTYD